MNAKLTLRMDQAVINSMKVYASDNNSSLSKLVENFFKNVLESKRTPLSISPLVQELSGIISQDDIDKNDYHNYLEQKYE